MTASPTHGRFFAVLSAAMLFACAMAAGQASAATGRVTLEVNGQKRTATLVERARLKRAPRTTIIVLRAAGAARARAGLSRVDRFLGLDELASAGTVLAFPGAVGGKWDIDGGNDVAMVRALAQRLVNDGVADKRRIFIAGVSSGGLLALKILCDGADFVAGAAVLIANTPSGLAPACKPARAIPFLQLAGTADPIMPYKGGEAKLADFKGEVASAEATRAPFEAAADCGKARATEDMPDKDPKDGSRVYVERPQGCKAPIEFYRVEGGGHVLPGRPARADRGVVVGARNNDIDTARVLMEFFRRAAR